MTIQFQCPICASEFVAPDEFAGRQARCGGCQNVVEVPQASQWTTATTGVSFYSPPATPPFTSATATSQNKTALWVGAGIIGLGLVLATILCGGFYLIGLDDNGLPPDHPANWPIAQPPPRQRPLTADPPPAWKLQVDPPEDSSLAESKVDPQAVLPERLSFSRQPGHYAIAEEQVPDKRDATLLRVYDLSSGQPFGSGVVCTQHLDRRAALRDLSPSGSFFVAAEKDRSPPAIHVFYPLEGKLRTTISLAGAADDKFGLAIAGARRLVTAHADEGGELTLQLHDLIQPDAKLMKIRHVPVNNERFDLATVVTSPGGRYAAILTQSGERLLVWDLFSGKLVGDRAYSGGSLWPGLAFSPDGKRLARICKAEPGYQLSVIDLVTGEARPGQAYFGDLKGNQIAYRGARLEWSASGQYLLFCGQDIIDAQSGKLVDAIRHDDVLSSHAWCRIADDDLVVHQRRGSVTDKSYGVTPLAERLVSAPPPEPPPVESVAVAPSPPAPRNDVDPMPRRVSSALDPESVPPRPADPPAKEQVIPAALRWERPEIAWGAEVDPPATAPVSLTKKIRIPLSRRAAVLPRDHRPFAAFRHYDQGKLQIQSYDLRSGQPVGKLVEESWETAPGVSSSPELSPDGMLFAMRTKREMPLEFSVFSLAEGRRIATLAVPKASQFDNAIRFLDERRAFTAHHDEQGDVWATIWNAPEAKTISQAALEYSRGFHVHWLAVSPGGRFVAMRGIHGRYLGIWRLADGKLVGTYDSLHAAKAAGPVAFSPDGKRLAMIDRSSGGKSSDPQARNRLIVLDVVGGKPTIDVGYRAAERQLFDLGNSLTWSADQKWLLGSQEDVLDAATGECVARLTTLRKTEDSIEARIVGPDMVLQGVRQAGNDFVDVGPLKSAWQPIPRQLGESPLPAEPLAAGASKPDPSAGPPATVDAEDASADPEARLAAALRSEREARWEIPADPPAVLPTIKAGKLEVKLPIGSHDVIFPPGPSRFCVLQSANNGKWEFTAFDLSTGKPIGKPIADDVRGHQPVVSSDGRYLADFDGDRQFTGVWSFATGERTCRVSAGRWGSNHFTFVGSHRLVTLHGEDQQTMLAVWDVRTGEQHGQMIVHDDQLSGDDICMAPSPGGKLLAIMCETKIKIVELSAGKIVGERSLEYFLKRDYIRILGRSIDLTSTETGGVAFSPDGMRLVAVLRAGSGGLVVCLDARTGGVVFERLLQSSEEWGANRNRFEHENRLDWTSDGQAIQLGGSLLIDAATGKDLLTLPWNSDLDQPRRVIRPWDLLTIGRDKEGDDYLFLLPLPKDAIAKALAEVQGEGEAIDALLPPRTQIVRDAVVKLPSIPDTQSWAVPVDGVPYATDLRDRIELASGNEKVRHVRFAGPASDKLVVVKTEEVNSDKTTWLQQFDARSKAKSDRLKVHDPYRLADVSQSGNAALLAFPDAEYRYERLDLVGFNPKKHLAGWRPFADADLVENARQSGNLKALAWAAMVGDDHAVTLSKSGRLVGWKVPECSAVYETEGVSKDGVLHLSPGHRSLAIVRNRGIDFLDTRTGAPQGRIVLPPDSDLIRCAFRDDGRELLVWSFYRQQGQVLRRYDLATGKLVAITGTTTAFSKSHPWPLFPFERWQHVIYRGDGTILEDACTLFDVQRGLLAWRYVLANSQLAADNSPDGRLWYCYNYYAKPSQSIELMAATINSPDIRAKTAAIRPQDQQALGPGGSIRLLVDLKGAGLGHLEGRVEAACRKALADRSVTVDPTARSQLSIVAVSFDSGRKLAIPKEAVVIAVGAEEIKEKFWFVPDIEFKARLCVTDDSGLPCYRQDGYAHPYNIFAPPTETVVEDRIRAARDFLDKQFLSDENIDKMLPPVVFRHTQSISPGETFLSTDPTEKMPDSQKLDPINNRPDNGIWPQATPRTPIGAPPR